MPGAMGAGKPIEERTKAELIGMFIVGPILTGGGMLFWVVVNTATHWAEFSLKDWLWQVVWFGGVGLVLMFGLPAVGWAELRKRKQKGGGPPPDPYPATPRRRKRRSRR